MEDRPVFLKKESEIAEGYGNVTRLPRNAGIEAETVLLQLYHWHAVFAYNHLQLELK